MDDFEELIFTKEYDEFVLLKQSVFNSVIDEGSLFEQFLTALGLIEDIL